MCPEDPLLIFNWRHLCLLRNEVTFGTSRLYVIIEFLYILDSYLERMRRENINTDNEGRIMTQFGIQSSKI